jgi:hypothetical protein
VALESLLGPLALEATLAARFGKVSQGVPVSISTTTATAIATPTAGGRVRLKWISIVREYAADESANKVTLRWASGSNIYTWPIGYIPAFMHSVVREGTVDQVLQVQQTVPEVIIVNLDWEQF